MPSSPPTKRKRIDADTGESDLPVERSAQFWFDDGNVVLQAESTQFRVHRSILSHHSQIMKDCFKCPQPEGAPTVEGCPLVHLPDLAKDIGNLCGLLYGTYHIGVEAITSSILGTMLLMGRKYEIESFTTAAESILRQLFPPTLVQWVACQDHREDICLENKGFLFDVFNLVYEYPLPSIMQPLLISMCTNYDLASIMSGVPRHDQLDRAILNPSAKQYCVLGRMTFMQLALQKFMNRYCEIEESGVKYTIPTSTCSSKAKCLSGIRDIATELVMDTGTKYYFRFLPPAAGSDPYYMGIGLCFACFAHLQELIEESRRDVWTELPGALEAQNAVV